jgi:hypothetical protein
MDTTTKLSEREDFLRSVLSTAVEGGTNYWAQVSAIKRDNYRAGAKYGEPGWGDWTYLGYTLHDIEEDGKKHVVTTATVERGLKLLTQDTKISLRSDLRKAVLLANVTNDGGEIDADAADCVVQAGIFGEIIYG